jgi:hypothetical protein
MCRFRVVAKVWRRSGAGRLVLLCCWAAACGGAGQGSSGAQEPVEGERLTHEELAEQFQREAEPGSKQPVTTPGAWSAYIEAVAPPKVERHDKFFMVVADVGWEGELSCFVYDDAIDPGTASNAMIQAAAEQVDFKQLAAYRLDHAGLDPLIAFRGLYNVAQEGGVAAGDYKLMLMPRAEYPVVCVHDAPGYAESFVRATFDFAKSFEFESEAPRPTRGELWWSALEGVPVGFSQKKTYELKDGGIRRVLISAAFIPTAPGEIAFHDRASIVNQDKSGSVTSAKYLAFENGESAHAIDIEKSKKKYDYLGTVQGKEVRGTFQPKAALRDEYALELKLKALAKQAKKSSFDQWEYAPEIDPAGPSKVSYEISPEGDLILVVAKMGDRAVTMKADGRGIVRQVILPIGGRTVEVLLVEELGDL